MLNEEQITFLFQFCEKHYVRYYDVQVELVDHLASAIEAKMENDPNLQFEDCLQTEYKGFGATGFGKYISEKEKQVIRILTSERRQILRTLFSPPQIFLVIILAIILILPFVQRNIFWAKFIAWSSCIFMPISAISLAIFQYFQKKKRNKTLFLLENGALFSYISILNSCFIISSQLLIRLLPGSDLGFSFNACGILVLLDFIALLIVWAGWQQYKILLQKSKQDYPLAFQ